MRKKYVSSFVGNDAQILALLLFGAIKLENPLRTTPPPKSKKNCQEQEEKR